MRAAILLGQLVVLATFGLVTCTSMGAGMPVFRMASTIEPL